MFTPKSKIYHKLGHTDSGSHNFQNFNRHYFMNKWVNSGRIDDLVTRPRDDKPIVRTILLKRSGARGDVLMAAAVASALKKKYKCSIMFLTDCPEVLKNNPYVDQIVSHDVLLERQFQVYYDLDMVYEYRPHVNILEAYAQAVGVKVADCELFIHTEPIEHSISSKYVVFHVGNTNWKGRNWTTDNFAALALEVQKLGRKVVVIGGTGDFSISADFDMRGKASIAQTAWLIKNSDLFVGIDSFPMHLAQAVNAPGVCFFGCIKPDTRIVRDNICGVTASSLPCLGCHHKRSTPCVVTNFCEVGGEPCISEVSVSMMLNKIIEKLSR